MTDNSTAHAADAYDAEVVRTIPRYDLLHSEVLDLVRAIVPEPRVWLDTGCGTGALVGRALSQFPRTRFILGDPSEAMLAQARQRVGAHDRVSWLRPCGTREIELDRGDTPAVITAILCHHYLDLAERQQSLERCHELLPEGGLLVSVENVAASTDFGQRVGMDRWRRFQVGQGRKESVVESHLRRCGTVVRPISLEAHLSLLRRVGFRIAEAFWLSVLQAGVYGVR